MLILKTYSILIHSNYIWVTVIGSTWPQALVVWKRLQLLTENINNFRYADYTTLMAESKKELRSLLMRVKESEKAVLKLNIQKLRSWHLVPSLHGKQRANNGKVMSLLLNTLSRFVIAFLPRSNHLLISWLQSLSAVILETKKRKSVTASTFFPFICHEMMGLMP